MMNVQEIRRNVINVVKNYSDAQVKVRKATSNEPWGPSSTLMSEIADLTHNVVAFGEIMQIIWKRLNDHGKNWRHVYKALVLLEYLIKAGSEKVAQQCRDNLFAIQTLKDFQHFEENKDQGLSIREKSKFLVNLLKDDEKLKIERARALKAKERFAQSLSCVASSIDGGDSFKPSTSSSYHESLSSSADPSSSRSVNPDLENARPQTVGEEELQLQLALAMSKEEAEQEERLRKNDDLRLKLALQESEKNSSKKSPESKSAVDDLLSLNPAPIPVKAESTITTDPWGTPLNNNATLLSSPPNKSKTLDPWGVTTNASKTKNEIVSFDDPWTSNSKPVLANNDPWGNTFETVTNDPWNAANNDTKPSTINDLIEPSSKTVENSIRRTPENFLGPNSSLVNLDALVSSKTNTSSSPNNNPFASVVSSTSNPFQTNKPSQPTINQLRAQNNQLLPATSTTTSYSNANALSSLFSSPANNSNVAPFAPNTFVSNTTEQTNGLVWANFSSPPTLPQGFTSTSPQQNNPFAM